MVRPRKKDTSKKGNSISTWYYHAKGFNACKKLYDEHIPTKKEWIEFFKENKISKARLVAKLVYERLK